MRILLACAAFPPHGKGGGPVSSKLIAMGLAKLGHTIRVVTVADFEHVTTQDGFEVHTVASLNVHWNYWKHNPFWRKILWHILENFNPKAYFVMRRQIRDFCPDVLLTISIENTNVASWLAAWTEGLPCIHVIHSYFLRCWRGTMFKNGAACKAQCATCYLFSLGKKHLSRYVTGVTAETAFPLRSHIDAGYFANAVFQVIPGPIALPNYHRAPENGVATLRVGYIGIHSPAKGIETLAAAARELLKENLEIEFVIAGDGPSDYTQKLIKLFPPNAKFVGWILPVDFYPTVDVIVVPSVWHEPFGRVTAEAMSYGVPVIIARSGGLPETIVEGESGVSFAAGNYKELANALTRLAVNRGLLANMAKGALLRAQHFEGDLVSKELEKFIINVCQNKTNQIGAPSL